MGQSTWSVASAGTTNTAGSASPVPSEICENVKTPKERLGPILEAALYQAAKLHLKGGRSVKAISRWRSILMAEECDSTKDIRRAVCCQLGKKSIFSSTGSLSTIDNFSILAEALLHSNTDSKYIKPDPLEFSSNSNNRRSGGGSGKLSTESPWRPKRASNAANIFTPKNR